MVHQLQCTGLYLQHLKLQSFCFTILRMLSVIICLWYGFSTKKKKKKILTPLSVCVHWRLQVCIDYCTMIDLQTRCHEIILVSTRLKLGFKLSTEKISLFSRWVWKGKARQVYVCSFQQQGNSKNFTEDRKALREAIKETQGNIKRQYKKTEINRILKRQKQSKIKNKLK